VFKNLATCQQLNQTIAVILHKEQDKFRQAGFVNLDIPSVLLNAAFFTKAKIFD